MIRQIAPRFFTTDRSGTLASRWDTPRFDCAGTRDDPSVYAIVVHDRERPRTRTRCDRTLVMTVTAGSHARRS